MIGRILDFLLSLKHVHVGSGTRFGFVIDHVPLIVLGVLVLAVLGYLSYVPQAASPAKKKVMGVVRGVLLAVVLLLACRPELVMEHEEPVRSVVAVWIDSSASMTLEDPYTGPGVDPAMRAYLEKVSSEIRGGGGGAATAPASIPAGRADRSRVNRYELATATLADSHWLKELTETQDVLFFTGSARAEPLGMASKPADIDARLAQLRTAAPEGTTTDVPTVVRDILERVQGQRLSAMILLTDGQTTERGSRMDQSAGLAQQADTKVFAIPLGQEGEPFNLKITTMQVPESSFTRDPVSARIHIAAAGINQPTPVKISVFRKSSSGAIDTSAPLATKELTLDPTKKELDADLPIRLKKTSPGKGERFDLVARVEPAGSAPEERTLQDNERSRSVTVLDAQINVLYVEGYPRWEYRYLKSELIREPTINVSTLLLTGDQDFVQDADPAVHDKVTGEELFPGALQHFPDTAPDLAKYDVLLIGDVESTYFSPTQQKLIVDWVKTRGGGLGWLAGPSFNPEMYRETALEVLLPVTADELDPRARVMAPPDNTPFTLLLTPEGRNTNLFRFFDDPDQSWKQVTELPPMFWFKPVQGLKPGAIVLARHPTRSQGGVPAPLLVMRQFGAGPVLFSAYADTWRWRRYTGEPLFQSYWLQFCRLLYANKALGQSKRLDLASESQEVEIGAPIKVSLTVKDPTLAGQMPAELPVMVVDKDGRTVQTITLQRPAGNAGSGATATSSGTVDRLEGSATAERVGDFTLQVRPGSLPIEMAAVDLKVSQPQKEFETTTADMQSLRSLAAKTQGKVIPPNHTEELRNVIPDRSMPILHAESEELWNKPFALILVVGLATVEWLIRKSAGLI